MILFLASIVFLSSKLVFADSVYIDMVRVDGEDAAGPLGAIWAVDSWFLTLVTLNFKLSDVPSGSYQVRLHEMPDCDKPGDVYNPYGDFLVNTLHQSFGEEVIQIRTMGGTVPISPFVNELSRSAFILPGVKPDKKQHSPNENVKIGQ